MKAALALALAAYCLLPVAGMASPRDAIAFPGREWGESKPEEQGLDGRILAEALELYRRHSGEDGLSRALLVRNGRIVWRGPDIDVRQNVWSITKSFTATVLGLLIDDGKARIDDRAAAYLPTLAQAYPDVTLRHFATMTSGYDAEGGKQSRTPFHPHPPLFPPGTRFDYSDAALNQFANVLTRIADEPIRDLFRRRVADPIGMDPEQWDWGDWGHAGRHVVNGGGGNKRKGISISARELARFGLLYLNQGNWDGRQVLSPEWIKQATRAQVPPAAHRAEDPAAYGFGWWANGPDATGALRWPDAPESTFTAEGVYGNRLLVIPDWNMVFVRLGLHGDAPPDEAMNRFIALLGAARGTASELDRPARETPATESRNGPITVGKQNRSWLYHADGSPFFLCGAGDPEDFLYRGRRRPDGTRDGDQRHLIEKLKGTGANAIYMQVVRSHGGDGEHDHNPFIGSDPAKGLAPAILDQWDAWFSEMDRNGIVAFLMIYDDSARIWRGDRVGSAERGFIEALVRRFAHIDHLIWAVGEEVDEAYSPARVRAIAEAIRAADGRGHPVAVHRLHGIDFDDFAEDPNIDQFAIQFNSRDPEELHEAVLAARQRARERYNLNLAEADGYGTGAEARRKDWAVAMAGAYVMRYQADIASTPLSDLEDCGRLARFMRRAGFDDLAPRDGLAHAGTKYVLADPPDAYVAYAPELEGPLGLKGMEAGYYDFLWLDIPTGHTVVQSRVEVAEGDRSWLPPTGVGPELALAVRRARNDAARLDCREAGSCRAPSP